MDVIEQARLLAKAIQESEQYKQYTLAKTTADNDSQLQDLIGQFNLYRMQINQEVDKEDKSEEKIKQLNEQMREAYQAAMANQSMVNYTEKEQALSLIVNNVKQIIDLALNGEDPMTCQPSSGCTGSCATCGGCH